MKRLNLIQGTTEWAAHRRTARNASEAAAMLGVSPYLTRTDLLTIHKTGIRPEATPEQQRRFDKGHAIEPALRAKASKIIGEPLYPVVGTSDDGYLSGSFDGLTMAEDISWECKSINEDLRAVFTGDRIAIEHNDGTLGRELPIYHQVQMEQGLLISGAEKCLFSCGDIDADGNVTEEFHCWYLPNPKLRAKIMAGWQQFDADLEAFEPQAAAERVTAAPIEALPAISAQIMGELTISSNLPAFGDALRAFVARIPAKPTSEQEFADAEAACKALKKAEDALDGAEQNALGQVQSVEVLTRTIADLRSVARTARLATEKLVKARKEQIRIEECQRGRRELDAYVHGLNQQIGGPYMPAIAADFGAAISGVKTIDSLRARVDQLVADKKIEAAEVARVITLNLRTYKAHGDYEFLFADLKGIVTKQPDDFQALVQSRVLKHQQDEAARLEKERERIRQEEAAKLQREQQEREAAERRQQREAEARAQQSQAAQTGSLAPGMPSNSPAAPVAQAANMPLPERVTPLRPGKATLKVGDIQDRLGIPITGHFIENTLGIKPAKREKSAVFFLDTDWDRICQALMFHVDRARKAVQLEAA